MKPLIFATAALVSLSVSDRAMAENTKEIVRAAMTELMVNKNVEAIDTYFSEPYIQHNPRVPTGLEALKNLASKAIAGNPAFKYEMIRVFADGEFGITHGIYTGFGKTPLVAFDVFRIEGEKIVEHWDALTPVAANNPSGRSQTDGPVKVTDLDQTDANKKLVGDFVTNVLIKGAFDKMPEYFDGDNYIQHNSNIADGVSGLGAGLKALAKAGVTMRITKIHKLLGEGNFVLVMSEGEVSGKPTAFYDLFRVQNGKIAEHWDVIAPIPPAEESANANGVF